jgi:hypothetical protein
LQCPRWSLTVVHPVKPVRLFTEAIDEPFEAAVWYRAPSGFGPTRRAWRRSVSRIVSAVATKAALMGGTLQRVYNWTPKGA